MNAHFRSLGKDYKAVIDAILARRSPALLEQVLQSTSVARSDARQIVSMFNDEPPTT